MCDAIKKHLPGADMALIDRAVDYANQKHKLQKRKDGSPYIIHPLAVAQIVAEMGLDCDAILGALLHDCIEDTDASHEDIEKIFGPTVAELVEGVTKLTRANFSSSEQAQMENLRKMFMAMSKDIRVVLIKIADRLHNMRTMQYQTPEKQIQKCRETMDVYAPLAHRLGMQKIKWELEDTALRYLAPMEYNEIMSYLQAHKEKDEAFMRTIQDKITQRLTSVGIHNTTYGRIKHVYSIYRKMLAQGKTIDELYDIYAFRVIVDTIPDCYNVLGHVHDLFSLVPGRFKDYISTPKPNGYQSLHTTVIGHEGIPFEVQIRTRKMDEQAEYGVAAHWKYKEGLDGHDKLDERLAWVSQLLENQRVSEDSGNLLHDLKSDLLPEEVFAFTPKGDVINLPTGATCIDFAYAIHSAVGNRMVGCKVNNRMVPIDHVVSTGEIIEVILGPADKGPSRDWLKIVRTSEAKSKIRNWFKKMRREENIQQGRDALARELRREMIIIPDDQLDDFIAAAKAARDIGVDAAIVSDLGAIAALRREVPELPLHVSTQASTVNAEAVRVYRDMGCERVILARETSIARAKEIIRRVPEMEIETFVHGASCMAYSGRCLLSAAMAGRSGNQGECAQPCRWHYSVVEEKRPGEYFPVFEDEKGTYIMNSRDMCMIDHLPALLDAGITSLKIEGRTKSACYVGAVTNAYRHALDDAIAGRPLDPVWRREVLQISHRPYSTGFYFGEPGQYTANSAYFAGAEVCAVVEGTAPDGRAVLTQRNKFAVGDTLELVTNAAPPVTFTAQDLCDADGLPLESVPHPMQRFTMPLPCRAAPLSLVRRKLPAETVDIRLECGKI